MNPTTSNLCVYLEIESILNAFFETYNYCLTHCIQPQLSQNRIVTGCCRDKYYKKYDLDHPAFELLQQEREKRFGSPETFAADLGPSTCEYHTNRGCRLKTHKSPICLSFLCKESIAYLRERYAIYEYDYLGVHYALEWILTGDLKGAALEDFKASCCRMLEKLKARTP